MSSSRAVSAIDPRAISYFDYLARRIVTKSHSANDAACHSLISEPSKGAGRVICIARTKGDYDVRKEKKGSSPFRRVHFTLGDYSLIYLLYRSIAEPLSPLMM